MPIDLGSTPQSSPSSLMFFLNYFRKTIDLLQPTNLQIWNYLNKIEKKR
ncbi:hypothetical protein BVRB_015170 [Beta vulgaris subsp. vulgaris]|uniref:Uncharacterized protein n=1 Tax=Beta vulgaris subsp. vulgaris TaxID=3555 RepID=A0A0J8B1B8_BETVV|nr:hypothetical protein BVRB_015170 [Beta vulgaris subsp. vulgaris]